jgi:20S proteasome alpha/beta subunit
MTLAIAINALDGLVLATDTRKTGRTGAKDDSDKLMPVNRDIGVLTYGLAEPGHAGMTQLIAQVDEKLWGHFTLIATEAKRIFQESYDGWVAERKPQPKRMPGSLGFILGGYDHLDSHQFRIVHYELQPSADKPLGVMSMQLREGQVLAGRWNVAHYLTRKLLYPEMTVREVAELSALLLAETMVVESTVGGSMELAVVTREKGFENLHAEQVAKLLRSAQSRFAALNRMYRNAVLGQEAHLL